MEKKITNVLDNLTIEQTERLLDYNMEMQISDKDRNRIKNSVFEKIGSKKRKEIYIPKKLVVGLAAACALFAVFILPQLLKSDVDIPPVAMGSSPTPGIITSTPVETNIWAEPPENNLPAYSQKLCSFAVQLGEWVYYSNPEDKDKLYKVKEDGTGKTKLSDKRAWDVQVVGDWVYFVNDYTDSEEAVLPYGPKDDSLTHGYAVIYKISVNGGEEICIYKTKKSPYKYEFYGKIKHEYLRTIMNMVVNNNKVYFEDSGIYKIDINGENKTMITKTDAFDFSVVDGYIYYYDFTDKKIYKMRDDGTEKTKFIEFEKLDGSDSLEFTINDGWLYYTNPVRFNDGEKDEAFYKIRLDGTEKTKLTDKNVFGFIVDKDWIYYYVSNSMVYDSTTDSYSSNDNDYTAIYKMKTDGSENQLLLEEYDLRGVVGEWIYIGVADSSVLAKIRTDGTELQKVNLFEKKSEEIIDEEIAD